MRYNGLKRDRFAVFGAAARENMLKQLKFDFYKILKSKTMLFFWILPLLLLLLEPVLFYVIQGEKLSVFAQLRSSSSNLFLAVIVFSVLLCAKDISSGYIKNIYTFSNKLCYILSKVVYLFAFCLTYMIAEFLINTIFNVFTGVCMIYDVNKDLFPAGSFFLSMFTEALNSTAIGVVCCFLCMLLKKEYIVLIIALLYLFVGSGAVYIVINTIIGHGFSIEPYTLFSFWPTVDYDNLFWETILPGVIVPVCYILVFGFFSWLILKKRNV